VSKASVVAGSSRFTAPFLIWSTSDAGRASLSTFRPTASAVLGLTPPPTPPCLSPAIARWSWRVSPQNASLPKVSERNVRRPSSIIRWVLSSVPSVVGTEALGAGETLGVCVSIIPQPAAVRTTASPRTGAMNRRATVLGFIDLSSGMLSFGAPVARDPADERGSDCAHRERE
jgi:hypothetical protein